MAPANYGVSLGLSRAPASAEVTLSAQMDVCHPLREPSNTLLAPKASPENTHAREAQACPVGEVCSRKPLCTRAWTPSTQTLRYFFPTQTSVFLLDYGFGFYSGPLELPQTPPHVPGPLLHLQPRRGCSLDADTRVSSDASPARLPKGASAGPEDPTSSSCSTKQ